MKELIDKDVIEKRRVYYTTILSQLMSADGRHLIAACKSGKLVMFNLEEILKYSQSISSTEPSEDGQVKVAKKPSQTVETNMPAYSLSWIDSNCCLVGGKDRIKVFNFADGTLTDSDISLQMPASDVMVNAMLSVDNLIVAGCGDNNIYLIDSKTQTTVGSLQGHEDYINSLAVHKDNNTLFSASEDGSVRIWDFRQEKSVGKIEPHKMSSLNRPSTGKWVGALAVDGDWLVCGGGPRLGFWHLRSLAASTVFDAPVADWTANEVCFHDDFVIAGGNSPSLFVWERNSQLKSQIVTSTSNIYSILSVLYEDSDETMGTNQVITAAGTSYKIDVCTNWKYKDFELVVG